MLLRRLVAGVTFLALWTPVVAQQRREIERPLRPIVRGTRGAVAAGSDAAADAGLRLLLSGGNAVDAGVAAMWAAAVVEFSHFGFGGEAPILIRTREGEVWSLPGVGTMPRAATAEFFRNRELQPGEVEMTGPNGLKSFVPVAGLMPALVPGMVDAGLVALQRFGTKTFAEAIAPAIELADGWAIDETRAGAIARARRFFERWPTSRAAYPPLRAGQILRQPDLARTLRTMVEAEAQARAQGKARGAAIDAVRDLFYRGEIARKIDAFSQANQGLLRYEDLAAFRVEPERALAVEYRGYTVYKPGFWTQGPAMLEALNLLGMVDLKAMGWNTAEYTHRVVESLKLAYADRDTFYGDPRVVKVPGERLLSREYAAERAGLIRERASLEFRPGAMDGFPSRHPSQQDIVRVRIDDALMARDTTCVDAIDKDGIVFAATPSGAWLPSVIAGDTGIPLTQRAQSFLLVEGHPNELAGGKRPRVTLSPTLVTREGKPYLALSTPGGDNQDQSLVQVLLNVLEFGMNAQQAVEAGRFQTRHLVSSFDNHAMNPGDLLLDERFAPEVVEELRARGHRVERRTRWASGAAPVVVRFLGEVIEAGADPYGQRAARAW